MYNNTHTKILLLIKIIKKKTKNLKSFKTQNIKLDGFQMCFIRGYD